MTRHVCFVPGCGTRPTYVWIDEDSTQRYLCEWHGHIPGLLPVESLGDGPRLVEGRLPRPRMRWLRRSKAAGAR